MAQIRYIICYEQGSDQMSPEVVLTRPDEYAAKIDYLSDSYDEEIYNRFCDEAHTLCGQIHGFWGSRDWYFGSGPTVEYDDPKYNNQ
jgi:hypothetical protein